MVDQTVERSGCKENGRHVRERKPDALGCWDESAEVVALGCTIVCSDHQQQSAEGRPDAGPEHEDDVPEGSALNAHEYRDEADHPSPKERCAKEDRQFEFGIKAAGKPLCVLSLVMHLTHAL